MKKMLFALLIAVLAVPVLAAPQPLVFCTGGEGGAYEALGQTIGGDIAKKIGAELEVLNTGGSVENAELLKDGDCHMAIMQADAVVSKGLPRDITVTDAHVEAVFWLHGKSGLDDFADLTDKANRHRAVAFVSGSGAEVTLQNFMDLDEDYKNVKPVEFDDWYSAAEATAQGFTTRAGIRIEVAGMLYVARPGFISATDILEDFGKSLSVGEIDESSFADAKDSNGNPLYTECELNAKAVNNLAIDTFGKPDTYCMRAQVVYNNAYHNGLDTKEARQVKRAVAKGINSNLKTIR